MSVENPQIGEVSTGCRVFGAYKAFVGIDGIVPIVHGPVGCYWSNLFFQLARNEGHLRSATSALHDRDVVFGTERRLRQALEAVKKHYTPEGVAVLRCCVPALIGEDIDSILQEEEVPVIHIDATGFKGREWDGYEDALLGLASFIDETDKRMGRTVNILGLDPISPRARADAREIRRLLGKCGYRVHTTLCMDSTLDEVRRMASSESNILLGGYGIKLAALMEERFHIPYRIVDMPYGARGTKDFLKTVTGSAIDEHVMAPLMRVHHMPHRFYDMPVALVGDSARVKAMKKFLSHDLGADVRFTGVISGPPEETGSADDLFAVDTALREIGHDLRIIFGTSFQKRIAHELDVPLVRISHPVFDEVYLSDNLPHMGYRGMVVMIETILNLFLTRYSREEW
jgi:nitrogenase molybdenum-iron protein beta chain